MVMAAAVPADVGEEPRGREPPSEDELAWAGRVIAAHDAAEAAGSGVALLDGRLIERLHVEEARRTLVLAAAIDAT